MSLIYIQIDSHAPKYFLYDPHHTFQSFYKDVGVETLSWVDDNGSELCVLDDETRFDEVKHVLKGCGTREDPYIANTMPAGTVLSTVTVYYLLSAACAESLSITAVLFFRRTLSRFGISWRCLDSGTSLQCVLWRSS